MKHFLLYTTDREHGGTKIEGIFESAEDAWDHHRKTYTKEGRYWRIPFVDCWQGGIRIDPPPETNS